MTPVALPLPRRCCGRACMSRSMMGRMAPGIIILMRMLMTGMGNCRGEREEGERERERERRVTPSVGMCRQAL